MSYSLSVSDLLLVEGFKEAWGTENQESINKILFENGMDTTQDVEIRFCKHRNLQNQIVDCERYEGEERVDRSWLSTGVASLNAWVNSTNDLSLRNELRGMSKEEKKSDFSFMKQEKDRSKKMGGGV